MDTSIENELKLSEEESALDFSLYFLKHYSVSLQVKWNLEFELERLKLILKERLLAQASQRQTYRSHNWESDSYSPNYDIYEKTARSYNVLEFCEQLKFAKQQIEKLGFPVWYLSTIRPLKDQILKLSIEKRRLDAELQQINREIDAFDKREEINEEHRRQEHLKKAERLKLELEKKVVITRATEEQVAYIKMRYKNLKFIGKEHFRLIAPDYFKFIDAP